VTYAYDNLEFRRSGGSDFIPRLWATRKIGALLNQIRLRGVDEETVDQIVRLSIRYGIITPYTSYLVTEPSAIGAEAQNDIVADALEGFFAAPMEVTGEKAVGRAAAESEIREPDVAPSLSQDDAELVRFAGTRTFRWVNGVWVDTAFDPQAMDTLKVPFLSEDYFALASSKPDIGAALALGSNVIVVGDQVAYEIVDESQTGDAIVLPEPFSPDEEADDSETEVSIFPENSDPTVADRALTVPCLGSTLVSLLPLAFVFRHLKAYRD